MMEDKRKGIYILPNLFTTAALFAGFYAIVQAMKGEFWHAAVAVFIAMVMDGLDGRVARWTHTESDFGAQYDSLSDMVSFGLAPALVVYEWGLSGLGKLGWLAAFIYSAAAALRLARFNIQTSTDRRLSFHGLPSPAAAAVVTGLVWVLQGYGSPPLWLRITALAVTVLIGAAMVSNIRYHSFKHIDLLDSGAGRPGREGARRRSGQEGRALVDRTGHWCPLMKVDLPAPVLALPDRAAPGGGFAILLVVGADQ